MELLETVAQSHEIEKIIDDSNDFLILVSPYLKINNRLKPKLANCFNRNNRSLILFREKQLTIADEKWFKSFTTVTLIPIKNLHAKCYLNEKTALITSMNLYDYSQVNNHEIGIKFSIKENKNEIRKLHSFIKTIVNTDFPEHDYSVIDNSKKIYTMGELYAELVNLYDFPDKHKGIDSTYEYMCKIARIIHQFPNEYLKQDKSTLMRNTPLNESEYTIIKKEIIKKGKLK